MSDHKKTIEQKINEALDNIDLITDPYQKADLLLKAAEVMIRVEGVNFGECNCGASEEVPEKKTRKTKKHSDTMKRQPEILGTEDDDTPKEEKKEEAPSVEENAAGFVEEKVVPPPAETPEPEDPWAGHKEEVKFIDEIAAQYGDEAIDYALTELSSGLYTDWKAEGAVNPNNISALVEVIKALMQAGEED